MAARPLVVGNWKMNLPPAGGPALAAALAARARAGLPADLAICPPATLLAPVADALAGSPVALGGQDCHAEARGAFTGDVSAAMLRAAGCRYAIVGHSERRAGHGETDAQIRAKAEAALAAGLVPIVCVGETAELRAAGRAFETVDAQLRGSLPEAGGAGIVVAYEPVWAIGTGETASVADIAEMHARIREALAARGGGGAPILYGGSVKPSNAAAILAEMYVDGALVGGASLEAADFLAIAAAAGG